MSPEYAGQYHRAAAKTQLRAEILCGGESQTLGSVTGSSLLKRQQLNTFNRTYAGAHTHGRARADVHNNGLEPLPIPTIYCVLR